MTGAVDVAAAILAGANRLAGRVDDPTREAELLLAHVLGTGRATLRTHPGRALDAAGLAAYESLLERRAAGVPYAYLAGRRGFWSLDLEVMPEVLVPRPETERLVELALERLRDVRAPRVLDLGTGSGAIGLALAAERGDARVDLVDASESALAVAERNRVRLGIANARTLRGDWFGSLAGACYHVVLSNPPYLAADDPHLPSLAHEPRVALVAGPTGLEALETIAHAAPAHLEPGGWLLLEHGATQGADVRARLAAAGLVDVTTHRDLTGLERVTLGRRAGAGAQSRMQAHAHAGR